MRGRKAIRQFNVCDKTESVAAVQKALDPGNLALSSPCRSCTGGKSGNKAAATAMLHVHVLVRRSGCNVGRVGQAHAAPIASCHSWQAKLVCLLT